MKTEFEIAVDRLRSTGRTKRMLDALEKAVNEGHYCFVICASVDHRRDLMQRFKDQIKGTIAHHKVYPPRPAGQATFEAPPAGDIKFDYEYGKALGAFPGCKYFMDHFAFEEIMQAFRWAVEQWEKWSLPEEQPKKSPMVGVDLGFKSLCPFVIDHANQKLISADREKPSLDKISVVSIDETEEK